MSHVETYPNIFIPYERYIPVKWDFSYLGEKLEYYLSHAKEASEIALNAYSVVHKYCNDAEFVKQMTPLFLNKNDY